MNKNEFMKKLEQSLKHIPKEDREDALNYYREYFEEMGADDSLDVSQEAGKPEDIAKDIIANCTEKHINEQKEKGGIKSSATTIWMIILAIFASPIAIPLALTAVLLLFAFLLVLFSLVFAIAVSGLAFVVTGLTLIFITFFAPGFAQKLLCFGSGLAILGAGLLFLVAMILFGNLCIRGIANLFKAVFLRKKVA